MFANGVICFQQGYRFFMIALKNQQDVAKIVREIKGLLPAEAIAWNELEQIPVKCTAGAEEKYTGSILENSGTVATKIWFSDLIRKDECRVITS